MSLPQSLQKLSSETNTLYQSQTSTQNNTFIFQRKGTLDKTTYDVVCKQYNDFNGTILQIEGSNWQLSKVNLDTDVDDMLNRCNGFFCQFKIVEKPKI